LSNLTVMCRCWLFDLAQQLPTSVQLHGYDISDQQFPAADIWPQNVELGVLDSLADPPAFLKAKYDVIHLRMWASNVGTSDSKDLIRHTRDLLSEFQNRYGSILTGLTILICKSLEATSNGKKRI